MQCKLEMKPNVIICEPFLIYIHSKTMYLIIYLIGLIYFCKYMLILYLRPGATKQWESEKDSIRILHKTIQKRFMMQK